ncbi:hypothetical protein CONPUDRAFT_147686 [Coniophora puteana RWD-64-598 SS2]|uniref:Protein kinase domain-containing protein n=1 Tax=Coniophora puteana (strain RWD-64-598) TaxID=741705 RepID=R7SEY2_CONPW|nr:uncharacterized protein CONPUDRAFT_147686 [Coniophora puteana RWD-64-598 SS2]EIW74713.1 hypothetical protein CONPUDRAFT_147686 [Coniophora puteana RWD-64-598 SS2]
MATIQFPVDLMELDERDEFVTLESDPSVAPPFDSTPRRITDITGFISRGETSMIPPENLHEPFVFRARLDIQWDDTESVVCKAGYGKKCTDKLRKEALIYGRKLSGLQGTCVPQIYGYYTGYTAEDGRLSVLVMEDCGQPLPRSLNTLPRSVKKSILECLIKLHKAGVWHGDVDDEMNIVVRPSKNDTCEIRFVDFSNAQDNHTCGVNPEFLEDTTEPTFDRIRCKEIYQVWLESELWVDSYILFYDKVVPVEQMTTPENLLAVTNILNELEEHEDIRDWEARDAAEAEIDYYRERCEARKHWESTPLYAN